MSEFYIKNNVLRSALLDAAGVVHGFSTRLGGTSALEYTKSMNLAFGRGDKDEVVIENRRLFAAAVGYDPARLVTADQIHSDIAVYADGSVSSFPGADALVTDVPGVAVGVKTADCQPILFSDPEAGIVAACHAGWRGTVAAIAEKTVCEMVRRGADRKRILAALGPCIGKCCFEVKDDFIDAVRAADHALLRFIDSYHADLRGMNEYILARAGIAPEHVAVCLDCTCCDGGLYYSHRRQRGVRGTMMSVICIPTGSPV